MKRGLKRWLSLVVTAAVLALVVYLLSESPEWRQMDWSRLWRSLVHVRWGFLLAAIAATLSSYLVRAYRWRFFLDPIKKNTSLWVLFVGQVLGFSSIYLIGRPGEFVRPAYIAKKENVPISSMLAVLVLERIYDIVLMVLLFAVALHFAPLHATAAHATGRLAAPHKRSLLILGGAGLAIMILVLLRLYTEGLATRLARIFRFLPGRIRQWLKNIFRSFANGLAVIRNWKDLLASLASTALIWFVNASTVWLVLHGVGGQLEKLTWMDAVLVLFAAAVGLSVQVPGLGGGYQVAAALAMQNLFHVGSEVAARAAILLWIIMMAPCVMLGMVLLIYEGLSLKKLRAIAEEERAEVSERV